MYYILFKYVASNLLNLIISDLSSKFASFVFFNTFTNKLKNKKN